MFLADFLINSKIEEEVEPEQLKNARNENTNKPNWLIDEAQRSFHGKKYKTTKKKNTFPK